MKTSGRAPSLISLSIKPRERQITQIKLIRGPFNLDSDRNEMAIIVEESYRLTRELEDTLENW